MKAPPLTDELSVLSRRGATTPSEERRLEMLLGASPVERFLDSLGRDCDAIPLALPGDERLLAQLTARLAAAKAPPRRSRSRGVAIAGGASLLLASAVAAAVTAPTWLAGSPLDARGASNRPEDPPAACADCATGATRAATSPTEGSPPVAATAASAVAAHARETTDSHQKTPAKWTAPSSLAEAPLTAAEHFAKANALRRAGQLPAAVAAYWQLQKSHPSSPEAHLSHVVLGRLLLQQGSAAAAEAQFGRYLAATPGGSLAEEALFGRASALRNSGRTAEERRVLRDLVARFPTSISARAARARLEELD